MTQDQIPAFDPAIHRSWQPELTDGSGFGTNALRFETYAEAFASAYETFYRWFGAKDYRAMPSADPVNTAWDTRLTGRDYHGVYWLDPDGQPARANQANVSLLTISDAGVVRPGVHPDVIDRDRAQYLTRALHAAMLAIQAWDNPSEDPPTHSQRFVRRLKLSRLGVARPRHAFPATAITAHSETAIVIADHERVPSAIVPYRGLYAIVVNADGSRRDPVKNDGTSGADYPAWKADPIEIPLGGCVFVRSLHYQAITAGQRALEQEWACHVRPCDLARWLDLAVEAVQAALDAGDLPVARDIALASLAAVPADDELPDAQTALVFAAFAAPNQTPAGRKHALASLAEVAPKTALSEILKAPKISSEIQYLLKCGLLKSDRARRVAITPSGQDIAVLVERIGRDSLSQRLSPAGNTATR